MRQTTYLCSQAARCQARAILDGGVGASVLEDLAKALSRVPAERRVKAWQPEHKAREMTLDWRQVEASGMTLNLEAVGLHVQGANNHLTAR